MVIYAGFPVALNTILTVANEVFYERNEKEKQNDY
jgi:4-carboxymuconolactone decarboxylase